MAAGEWSFAGLNLNDGVAYKVSGPAQIVAASPELLRQALARGDGSIKTQRRYPERTLRLSGRVLGASKTAKEDNLDALVKTLSYGEQILKTGWEDERYYLAELSTLAPLRMHGTLDLPFEAEFLLSKPFAYATSTSTVPDGSASSLIGPTHYLKTLTVTPGGTMYTPGDILLEVLTLGGTQAIWFVCPDVPGTPTLVITRTWSVLDLLEVDSINQSCKVNGVEVDYTGAFPYLDPRSAPTNDLEVHSISTSTPTFNTRINWTKRYAAA